MTEAKRKQNGHSCVCTLHLSNESIGLVRSCALIMGRMQVDLIER